jgi:hypothetical protein
VSLGWVRRGQDPAGAAGCRGFGRVGEVLLIVAGERARAEEAK